MKSTGIWLLALLFTPSFGVTEAGVSAKASDVQTFIDRAAQAKDPVAWANYLMKADRAAQLLEKKTSGGCCGDRCVRFGSKYLHFRFNEIGGGESYQHDLLQEVVRARNGEPEGAEALVRLLPTGCQTIASPWTPYFQIIIAILESRKWKALHEPRLTKMRAAAYETWWSLSMASDDDPTLSDAQLKAADFRDGAAEARARAVQAYREIVRDGKADADVLKHLQMLETGKDTAERAWYCAGD